MAAPSWTPPQEFDEYRLLRMSGHGAMGQVWLARDTVLQRDVAIKFLSARLTDAATRERFLLEARAIAQLAHPNVVTIHRVGAVEEAPYLVTEWLEGQSLDALPRPVDEAKLLELALGLARGLAAAHRKGVLHRDIKPANAFLTVAGEVKLLDFGLAKLTQSLRSEKTSSVASVSPVVPASAPADATWPGGGPPSPPSGDQSPALVHPIESSGLTRAGAIIGSPLYLAPECWRGETATTRSDVYSWGAMLYELGAGQAPAKYLPLNLSLQERVTSLPMRPLRELAPHVSAPFVALVDRCLKQNPEERPADATQLLHALERVRPRSAETGPLTGNPYRGLAPWEAEHRGTFFGRERETVEALERLKSDGAVIVTGASGVGKSSLLRAGVLPAVWEGRLDDSRTWKTAVLLPGRHPRLALLAALQQALQLEPSQMHSLEEAWRESPLGLVRWVCAQLGSAFGLVLVVDQLEELVTFSDASEAQELALVVAELTRRTPALRLLATVRHDALTRLGALPQLGQAWVRTLFLLGPIAPEALREVVVGPALARGVQFESEALVQRLTDFAQEGGALPLLQFTLASLWDAQDGERRLITEQALERLGGCAGSLSRYADEVIDQLPPEQQRSARGALTHLVGSHGMRVRRQHREWTQSEQALLNHLVQARLVVTRDSSQGATWELAHEALVTEWTRLREWLSDDAHVREVRERLSAAAQEWERLGRAPEALWAGRQLSEVAAISVAQLAPRDVAFVAAARRLDRWRRFRIPLAVAVALSLASGAWAAMRWAARRDLETKVLAHLQQAEVARERQEKAWVQGQAQEQRSFSAFDSGDWPGGESAWRQARAFHDEWSAALAQRAAEIEAALVLLPSAEVQQRLAEAVFSEAVAHNATWGTSGRMSALRARLVALDSSGQLAAQLDAPAQLTVSAPAQVQLSAAKLAEQDGELRLGTPQVLAREGLLAPGTWRIEAAQGERKIVQWVQVHRGRAHRVEFPEPPDVAPDWVLIPPGSFLFGAPGDDELRTVFFETVPQHEMSTRSYLIARHEVTFRQWLEYLRALPPDERQKRLPHTQGIGGYDLGQGLRLFERSGVFVLEFQAGAHRYRAAEGEPWVYLDRTHRVSQDWRDFPVAGVSADDAVAYAQWLNRSGRIPRARLCTELEWERAARGADGRWFPHGNVWAPDDANIDETYGRNDKAFGPDAVGSHPASASPWGIHDLMGNVWELVTSPANPHEFFIRGGSWYTSQLTARSVNRWHATRDFRFLDTGFRLCASVGSE